MTREEILRMEVGPKLDGMIGEFVTGVMVDCYTTLPYSTDIKEAWEVVEKMLYTPCSDGDCYRFKLAGYLGAFLAVFEHHLYSDEEPWSKHEHFEGRGKTAPEAICKAALLAMLEENAEVEG